MKLHYGWRTYNNVGGHTAGTAPFRAKCGRCLYMGRFALRTEDVTCKVCAR